jgi:hypothetical protein
MKNFIQKALFLLLLVVVVPAMAQKGQISFEFENTTGQDATDLHIVFRNGASKVADPMHPADATLQEPSGTFKNGQGDGSNKWDLAAGNGTGVANGGSVTLYFGFNGSTPEVKWYKWTNDNNLDPNNGVIRTRQNRNGWFQFTSADVSTGDGAIDLAVADGNFTFPIPAGLTQTEVATEFATFVESEIEFLHISSVDENTVTIFSSYLIEDVDNFTTNISPDTTMNTDFKYMPEVIPTLTEWGVIILLLLVVAIGMVFLYQRKTALAISGVSESSTAKPKLFDRKLFAKVFAVVLLIGATGLVAAYLYFGSITKSDPFGVVVSSGVVAYMLHLWLLKKS